MAKPKQARKKRQKPATRKNRVQPEAPQPQPRVKYPGSVTSSGDAALDKRLAAILERPGLNDDPVLQHLAKSWQEAAGAFARAQQQLQQARVQARQAEEAANLTTGSIKGLEKIMFDRLRELEREKAKPEKPKREKPQASK